MMGIMEIIKTMIKNTSDIILEKEYDGNSIIDIEEDIMWALQNSEVPQDDNGLLKGTFKITLSWSDQ